MKLAETINEHGTLVSVHQCLTCEQEFTICPASDDPWDRCQMEPCSTYDPLNDLGLYWDALVENGEISQLKDPP